VVAVAAAAAAAVAGRGASARRRNPRRSLDQSCRAGVSGRPDVGTACAGVAGKGGRAGGGGEDAATTECPRVARGPRASRGRVGPSGRAKRRGGGASDREPMRRDAARLVSRNIGSDRTSAAPC
jgi:hypothetical protein